METQIVKQSPVKAIFESEDVKKRFQEMLGKKAAGFMVSVINVVSSNTMLANADRNSILFAAATAASLDLPIDSNLGFAAIVPYNRKMPDGTYKQFAQFQMMWKGFVQLSMRSGQFETISAAPIYEGQVVESNPLTGYKFDFSKKDSDEVIGYAGYFQLVNGFRKTIFMTIDEIKNHGKKYSKTYAKNFGMWVDNFDAMAQKGLALDTKIRTANRGWTTMGDIKKGDSVFDDCGRIVEVIAVSEVKKIPCYKITFGNGQQVICDEEHDWVVRADSYSNDKKMNIKKMYERKNNKKKISIKTVAIAGERKDLPIDPYCFGYWLGDGSSSNSTITAGGQDVDYVETRFRNAGFDVSRRKDKRNDVYSLNISRLDKSRRRGGFKEKLEELGVLQNKHIPEIYEFSSFEQRLELIKGLFDSDGCLTTRRNGTPRAIFLQDEKRKDLVESVYRILCSIGEQPSKLRKHRTHGFNKYGIGYRIDLTCRNNLFSIPRKATKWRDRQMKNSWWIRSIEKIEPVETICIAVDSPSHTYLCTESQIPTHNTILKLLLSKYAPLSIEMQKATIADQGIVKDWEAEEVDYVDNDDTVPVLEEVTESKERKRVRDFITNAKTMEELGQTDSFMADLMEGDELIKLYDEKEIELGVDAQIEKKGVTK